MAAEKEYKALIVDDDSMIRDMNRKFLCKNGFMIEMAENGLRAIELFRAGNYFDLVVMDMDMPIMGGPQATKELRGMGVQSLIVGMSTSSSRTKIEAFKNAGLDDFFVKPISMAKVAAIVRHLKSTHAKF